MNTLHWPSALRVYRQLTGMAIAALLALNAAPSGAASERSIPAPDAAMVTAHAAAKGDGLLEALLTELDRSKEQLKMDQVQAPYYVEYRVNEVEDFGAEAAFGALRENQHIHVRVLRVVVRIGDYKQDSYFGRGQGESNILPLDDDPIALRHQIWLATDEAYKAAGEALAEKQAAMKQFSADPNPVDDFAKAPQMIAVEPTVSLRIDEAAWKKTLETVVALRKAPIVEEEYRGPVLFAADAADDIVASLIGQNMLGQKPQLGKPNRTTGAFATSYKTRVLPNFLSLVDDPTMKDFQGKSLVGSYAVDSEGVKAQAVNVIENGTLANYLIGRVPIRDFPASNGHGRGAPGSPPGPNLGVLLVKSSQAQSPGELRKKVVQMVK